jgi:hypothetical protein
MHERDQFVDFIFRSTGIGVIVVDPGKLRFEFPRLRRPNAIRARSPCPPLTAQPRTARLSISRSV